MIKSFGLHTASLGEFEQGLPIIEKQLKRLSRNKILVHFFLPPQAKRG